MRPDVKPNEPQENQTEAGHPDCGIVILVVTEGMLNSEFHAGAEGRVLGAGLLSNLLSVLPSERVEWIDCIEIIGRPSVR